MKVGKCAVQVEKFEPFGIMITVESAEEARALYAIFNHTRNAMLLSDEMPTRIKSAIGAQYYSRGGLLANGITDSEFYE